MRDFGYRVVIEINYPDWVLTPEQALALAELIQDVTKRFPRVNVSTAMEDKALREAIRILLKIG